MSHLDIELLGGGDTVITHVESGARVQSSKSPAFGGSGQSFSSTDLLAASLGSCIATNVEPVAERHSVAFERIRIRVEKTMSVEPKQIDALDVHITVEGDTSPDVLLRFDRAAHHCLVHKSLASHIAVGITVDMVPSLSA
jgi:uncharacterized OsmC-like protein